MTPPAAVLWSTGLFDPESPPHRDGAFDALEAGQAGFWLAPPAPR